MSRLDPNQPHPFVGAQPHPFVGAKMIGARCETCGRANTSYARKFHTPPFQFVPLDENVFAEPAQENPTWTRPLTEAEQKAACSAWPDYNGGKRHPFDTSTGMEGRCHHCGFSDSSPLHDKPWEPPLVANSAPVKTDLPAPVFADHSFEARQGRMRKLINTPAVSSPSGGEPENTKETNMKLNLTITVPGAESILPLLAALRTVDGVKLEDITEADQPPVYRSEPQKVAVGRIDMRRLLREATDERRQVTLDYTTEAGQHHATRTVTPVSFEDDLLLATDPAKGHGLRSFKLDRMQKVTLR